MKSRASQSLLTEPSASLKRTGIGVNARGRVVPATVETELKTCEVTEVDDAGDASAVAIRVRFVTGGRQRSPDAFEWNE